ncbi:MAG: hypothetical protein IID49_07940 [Proteobacteria bacterium]|nr:hypothetical protein [Pseudomonadota bacterium]
MENPAIQGGAPVGSSVQADPPEHTLPVVKTQRTAPQPVHVELGERRRRFGETFPVAVCSIAEVTRAVPFGGKMPGRWFRMQVASLPSWR